MKYPNASAGINKVFKADIIGLIAAVCGVFLALVTALTKVAGDSFLESGSTKSAVGVIGGGIFIILFGLAMIVLVIIGLVIKIRGLNMAGLDDANFKSALITVIIGLVLAISGGCMSYVNTLWGTILQDAASLASVIATFYILSGVVSIAEQIGNMELVDRARAQIIVICAVYAVSVITKLVADVMSDTFSAVLTIILVMISLASEIIQAVLYLIILNKARKVFAEE